MRVFITLTYLCKHRITRARHSMDDRRSEHVNYLKHSKIYNLQPQPLNQLGSQSFQMNTFGKCMNNIPPDH